MSWVGFDMDECLGQFLSLWPYTEDLTAQLVPEEQDRYLTLTAKRLAESNQHWLLRPGMDEVLHLLSKAQQAGRIYGCFIFSNNGSQTLVELVRRLLNSRVESLGFSRELFHAGWSRKSTCRKNLRKDWHQMQACLASEHFPPMRKLLFFDDMRHFLADEIPGYIQVPPYTHYTPSELIHHILTPVFQQMHFPTAFLRTVSQRSQTMEQDDLRNYEVQSTPPNSLDIQIFLDAIHDFLHPRTTTRKGIRSRTRPGTRRLKKLTGI